MKIIFSCVYCGQGYSAPPALSFFKVKCHKCQQFVLVPKNSAFQDIIELDAGEILDPNGHHREKIITYIGNERSAKNIPSLQGGCSWDEWDKTDPISQREIP